MLKTAVLVSGGGTNLQALIDYQAAQGESCPYQIVCVISDSKKAFALERAAKAGIPSAICSPYAVMGEEVAKASDRDTKRLAVSNAMRTLNDLGVIELKYVNDREDEWNLTPMPLHTFASLVTDVEYKGDKIS